MDWMTREELMNFDKVANYKRLNSYPHSWQADVVPIMVAVGLLLTIAFCARTEEKTSVRPLGLKPLRTAPALRSESESPFPMSERRLKNLGINSRGGTR